MIYQIGRGFKSRHRFEPTAPTIDFFFYFAFFRKILESGLKTCTFSLLNLPFIRLNTLDCIQKNHATQVMSTLLLAAAKRPFARGSFVA